MEPTIRKIIELWKNDLYSFWLFTIFAIFGLWACGNVLGFDKQDAAAWVQALGTIGAIFIAFEIPRMEQKNAQSKNEAEERKNLRAVNFSIRADLDKIAWRIREIEKEFSSVEVFNREKFSIYNLQILRNMASTWEIFHRCPEPFQRLIYETIMHEILLQEDEDSLKKLHQHQSTFNIDFQTQNARFKDNAQERIARINRLEEESFKVLNSAVDN